MANTILNTIAALEEALPAGRVVRDEETLRSRRHDYWGLQAVLDRGPSAAPSPAVVVRPQSTDEVASVMRIADQHRMPVVPFGLGSGVCGAFLPGSEALVLDLGQMDRLLDVDEKSLIASVQPGLRGSTFEADLNARGLTLGHFPQSIGVSSLGGWLATRASGQFSTRYGNIENMVLGLEVVLAGGRVLRCGATPRSSTGPDLKQLFIGSEGTLGVITGIDLALWPRPDCQQGFAMRLPSWEAGLEVTRELLQGGYRPAVLRLYDGIEAQRNFAEWFPEPAHLLLVLSEGQESMRHGLELEVEAALTACLAQGGTQLGREPLDHWLGRRNHVPSWDDLLAAGLVVDTIEVSATWRNVAPLYERVTAAMAAVPGILQASGHTSHAYTSGVNIYFTFVGQATDPLEQERIYRAAWAATMEATLGCGASIAHHHGIGRVRREWLPRELGDTGIETLRAVKAALDPNGILNPGCLI